MSAPQIRLCIWHIFPPYSQQLSIGKCIIQEKAEFLEKKILNTASCMYAIAHGGLHSCSYLSSWDSSSSRAGVKMLGKVPSAQWWHSSPVCHFRGSTLHGKAQEKPWTYKEGKGTLQSVSPWKEESKWQFWNYTFTFNFCIKIFNFFDDVQNNFL